MGWPIYKIWWYIGEIRWLRGGALQSVTHPPRFNDIVKAIENKGKHYTKIGNLDTIQEQQQDRVTVTDIVNIADITDIANRIKRSAFEYPLNLITLPMRYALIGQNLSKAVSRYFSYKNLLYIKIFVLYFLPKLMLINIDMSKLSVKPQYIMLQ